MRAKWRMPHPATMFLILTMAVVFLSWIFNVYDLSVLHPETGKEIYVQSLLSPEGIRWWLRHVVTNFTGFAPLGMVMIAMFGIGVAQHSGFIDACIRLVARRGTHSGLIITSVIVLGILSNVVGDAGYIILLPIAAALFHSAGLHPVGGIITAYVSVACGYSANVVMSTLDPLLAATTQEAADQAFVSSGQMGPLCNYYFFAASVFLLVSVVYAITRHHLLPLLGTYAGEIRFGGYKQLSRKERRAMQIALLACLSYVLLILGATFSSWGILRGVNGSLMRSPFIMGILFLLSFGIGLTGMVFGFVSGRYRSDGDVIEGLTYPMKLLGVYFVIAFFASQMFACLEYSQLDKCVAIMGADMLASLRMDSMWILILFILFVAVVNLFMVSATAKWAFMAFIFVPVLSRMGISPETAQCAFRIGDSATNAITPFMFYMSLVLTYMQQYDRKSTYGSLLKYTWRYSVCILFAWILLFILWHSVGLPLGL